MAVQTTALLGLDDVKRALKELPRQLTKDVLVDALLAAAKPIVAQARLRSLDDPELSGAIVARKATKRALRGGGGQVQIGIKRPVSSRAHFREFGVSPHLIEATALQRVKRKRLRRQFGDITYGELARKLGTTATAVLANPATGVVFGPRVHHPGHAARPYLRPALAAAGDDAIRAFGVRIKAGVEKAAERAAGGFVRLRGARKATP